MFGFGFCLILNPKQNDFYFINADEIAKDLDSKNLTKYKIKAGKIFFEELNAKLLLNSSFMIETTLWFLLKKCG